MTKKNEVAVAGADALAALQAAFPQEATYKREIHPRIVFKAQDVMEGKGKNAKCVIEAGTFLLDSPTDEKDENGKPVWEQEEVGKEIKLNIVFVRKQLRYYDSAEDVFISSPEFDDAENETVILFKGGKKYAEGLPKDLKAMEEFKEVVDGKTRSKLKENRVLYVLYNGELRTLTIHGSSMFAFFSYLRDENVPAVVTKITSEEKENGSINWNQMVFKAERSVTPEEAETVLATMQQIKDGIQEQKDFYASTAQGDASAVVTADALPAGKDDDDF